MSKNLKTYEVEVLIVYENRKIKYRNGNKCEVSESVNSIYTVKAENEDEAADLVEDLIMERFDYTMMVSWGIKEITRI